MTSIFLNDDFYFRFILLNLNILLIWIIERFNYFFAITSNTTGGVVAHWFLLLHPVTTIL